jgi:hypothetical protein
MQLQLSSDISFFALLKSKDFGDKMFQKCQNYLLFQMTESVQVALRIRPLVESEISRGCQLCLDTIPNESQVQVRGTDRAFTYNFVFGPEHSQSYIYDSAVKGLVARLFKGKAEFSAAICLF